MSLIALVVVLLLAVIFFAPRAEARQDAGKALGFIGCVFMIGAVLSGLFWMGMFGYAMWTKHNDIANNKWLDVPLAPLTTPHIYQKQYGTKHIDSTAIAHMSDVEFGNTVKVVAASINQYDSTTIAYMAQRICPKGC